MSWIKDKRFEVTLVAVTLVGAILIFMLGSKAKQQYDQAKADYDKAASEASIYEKLPLYPRAENTDGKAKALAEYRQASADLQAAFAKYRPADLDPVSPQGFTDRLKEVNAEMRKACEVSKIKLPDLFFGGFESYKTTLARGPATGILKYQLKGVGQIMRVLVKSGISEIKNVHRPLLDEESGRVFTPNPADVARPLPIELTFAGPEKAVREALSGILALPEHYAVIRTLAVQNSKKDPPRMSDAKFEAPLTSAPETSVEFVPFEAPKDGAAPAPPPPAPAIAPAPVPAAEASTEAAADSSRILAQVLGQEEVQVFLRLDLMLFLPAKTLPSP